MSNKSLFFIIKYREFKKSFRALRSRNRYFRINKRSAFLRVL